MELSWMHGITESSEKSTEMSVVLDYSHPNGPKQGLTNPLPGRPGHVLNPAGQVCSVFTTPGRASVKKSPGQLKVRVFTVKKSDQKMSINIDN